MNIITEGAGSHFEKNIVDVFMSIPSNKIVRVFLSENNSKILAQDEEILKHYNMNDIYRFVNSENLSEEEQNILNMFNKYYLNKPEGEEI